MIAGLLILVGVYLVCGILVAIPFVLVGVGRIDPHAAHGSWGFRLSIVPGAIAFWPLLLRRWIRGVKQPPEEWNAHRQAVQQSEIRNSKSAIT
jgi:hypothetical protein